MNDACGRDQSHVKRLGCAEEENYKELNATPLTAFPPDLCILTAANVRLTSGKTLMQESPGKVLPGASAEVRLERNLLQTFSPVELFKSAGFRERRAGMRRRTGGNVSGSRREGGTGRKTPDGTTSS